MISHSIQSHDFYISQKKSIERKIIPQDKSEFRQQTASLHDLNAIEEIASQNRMAHILDRND